jgi:hypothetical protein
MVSNAKETSSLDLTDRLTVAGCRINSRQKYGRALIDLATAVLVAHREEVRHFTDGTRVAECAGHFDAREEQHAWPCDQVQALARVLGVSL